MKETCREAIEETDRILPGPYDSSFETSVMLQRVLKNQLLILEYIGRQNKELCQ